MARIGKKETVLIVDDEEMVGDMLARTLDRLGYSAITCTSPCGALSLLSGDPGRIDMVIVDEIMPEMRGTQLTAQLLKIKDDLPVIMVTGYGRLIPLEEVRAAGLRAVLLKPVFTEQLRLALEHLSANPKNVLLQ